MGFFFLLDEQTLLYRQEPGNLKKKKIYSNNFNFTFQVLA
jgi:hypothetical protein